MGQAPVWRCAYDRRTLLDKAAYLNFTVEVVRGLQGQDGFQLQPRRWVVERTFAWLMRYRRLVRDYVFSSCGHIPSLSSPLWCAKAGPGDLIAGFSSRGIHLDHEQLAA